MGARPIKIKTLAAIGGVHPEAVHPDFVPRTQSEGRAPSPANIGRAGCPTYELSNDSKELWRHVGSSP